MADENEENGLSEEEYDALLRDLEGRAAQGESSAPEVDDDDLGDIDEFLKSVESDAGESTATKTRRSDSDDDLASEFAALEEKGELSAPPDDAGPSKKDKKKRRKKGGKKAGKTDKADGEAAPAEGEEPSRLRRALLAVGKNALWFAPAVVLWWVLGFYLAQWVSAGWLIAVMSALVVLAVPYLLRRLVKRGNYRPWMVGVSLVAVVALVAPMPNMAADRLAYYGHWPASTIAELTGGEADAGYVTAMGSATGWLGNQLSTTAEPVDEPRQLGTIFPLDMQWSPEEGLPGLMEELQQEDEVDEPVSPPDPPAVPEPEQQAPEGEAEPPQQQQPEPVEQLELELIEGAEEEVQEAVEQADEATETIQNEEEP